MTEPTAAWRDWAWEQVAVTSGAVLHETSWVPQYNEAYLTHRPDGYYALVRIRRPGMAHLFTPPGTPMPAGPFADRETALARIRYWLGLEPDTAVEVGPALWNEDEEEGGWGE